MSVRVEFLGMPRQYAGCDAVEVEAATLHGVLDAVARQLPEVAGRCMEAGVLKPGEKYLARVHPGIKTRVTVDVGVNDDVGRG